MKAIQKELGEGDEQAKEIDELRAKVESAGMPEPVKKEALLVGTNGTVRWSNGYSPNGEGVVIALADRPTEVVEVLKTRPDDFIWELEHIDASLNPGAPPSPLAIERGFDTMLAVAAAHRSQALGRTVRIDYSKGPTLEALV